MPINEEFYNKHYKKLMLIPLILFIISLFIIYNFYKTNNDIVEKDVTLKGGLTATIYLSNIDLNLIENSLKEKFPKSDVFVRQISTITTKETKGVIIEVSNLDEITLKQALEEILKIELTDENYSIEETGSKLGESFYNEMIKAMIFAFLFMSVVVFITFRTFIPSIAVISAALLDIVITLAIVDLIGLRVSTAGVAAFLLLIAYSIDTDILLTTRMVKRKEGSYFNRMISSIKTGLTMTATTLVALLAAYFLSTSLVLKSMFLIIIIGLVIDIISTYLMNAGILTWYLKKHET